jgi:dienelactone hydrolase
MATAPETPWTKRDALDDFECRSTALQGATYPVYVAGRGPAVIVMSEMPGIHHLVAQLARRIRDAGFTVFMPSLFGTPGRALSRRYLVGSIARACIRREFRVLASNRSSPITTWLRALAAHVHPLCGGKGVGTIGMCFTGNFALSLMLEPAVRAPVMSQPSLPMFSRSGLHLAPDELARVRERMVAEDLTVLAYRFEGDFMCPAERFAAYGRALGDRFQARVLPDASAAPDTPMRPHSVFTLHLIDRKGEPTRAALDEMLAFFAARLH